MNVPVALIWRQTFSSQSKSDVRCNRFCSLQGPLVMLWMTLWVGIMHLASNFPQKVKKLSRTSFKLVALSVSLFFFISATYICIANNTVRGALTWILPSSRAGPSSANLKMYRPMLYSVPPRRLKPKPLGPLSNSTVRQPYTEQASRNVAFHGNRKTETGMKQHFCHTCTNNHIANIQYMQYILYILMTVDQRNHWRLVILYLLHSKCEITEGGWTEQNRAKINSVDACCRQS